MQAKGYTVDAEVLKQEIAARDKADSEREISPLIQAADAQLVLGVRALERADLVVDQHFEFSGARHSLIEA